MNEITILIESFKKNTISLGELYYELLHLKSLDDINFEQNLKEIAEPWVMFLLTTYQKSQILI